VYFHGKGVPEDLRENRIELTRFFHEKNIFVQSEVEEVSQIDYVKELTIIAVVGEFGFGKVVAIGEYHLDEANNIAEIAFSVSKERQGKGLGKVVQKKCAKPPWKTALPGLWPVRRP
jgi:hypothetical protein